MSIREPMCCTRGKDASLKRSSSVLFTSTGCQATGFCLKVCQPISYAATQLLWFKPFCSSLSFSLRRVTERCLSDAIVFGLSWPLPSSSACSSTSLAHLPRSATPLLGLLGSCGPASRRGQSPTKTSTAWTLVLCLAGLQLWT